MNNTSKPRSIQELMRRIEDLEKSEKRLIRAAQTRTNKAEKTLRKIRAFVNQCSISNKSIQYINEILNQA